jgi:hypothetical protein
MVRVYMGGADECLSVYVLLTISSSFFIGATKTARKEGKVSKRVESREQRAESREQRGERREERAERRELQGAR